MRRCLFIYLICLVCFSCSTSSEFVKYRETINIDTLITIDSVDIKVRIKGDTCKRISDLIDIDRVIESKEVLICPVEVQGKFSSARAKVKNNRLHLELFENDIVFDSTLYIEKLNILEKRLEERSEKKIIVRKTFFWSNSWFYISVFLFVILILVVILVIRRFTS